MAARILRLLQCSEACVGGSGISGSGSISWVAAEIEHVFLVFLVKRCVKWDVTCVRSRTAVF